MTTRRAFLTRLALLGAGGLGLFLVRDRLPWPPLEVRFDNGRDTAWQRIPERGGLIEIPVTVDATSIRAVIDSGAQFSAIDRALAERLDLPRTLAAPILAYGVSGQPSLSHTVGLRLEIPGLTVPHLRAAVLDLATISRATGRDFHLLIGRDVLSRLVVEADFPGRRVRFLAPGAYRPPLDAVEIVLRPRRSGPAASIGIENGPPIEVLVDTGATTFLALAENAAREAGLLASGRPVRPAHSVSLGGLSRDRIVTARTVRIGRLTLRNMDVQIYSPAAHAPAPSGLLGAGLFRRFHMALDLAGQRLYLTPPAVSIAREPTL